MQIVIDISEDMYHDIIDGILDLRDSDTRIAVGTWLNTSISRSTVLPENHGRLIDADKLKKNAYSASAFTQVVDVFDIDNAPTILGGVQNEC